MQVAVERRPTLIFLLVLAALFILMSRSTETRVLGETRTLFERTVMTVFSPVPKLVNTVGQSFEDAYHGYLDMRAAIEDNRRLHRDVAQLTRDNLILRRSHGDVARLRSLLSYSEQFSTPTVLADVIMLDTASRFKSIILNRGSDAGVEVNDPVMNAQGLIGRVVLTTRDLSKVQLIIDQNASVGTLLERTRRQGVVRGNGSGGVQMYYVPSLSDVQPGDMIATAGIDGIFPRGVPVGTVVRASEGKDLFKTIYVTPGVDFGSLEEVIILHTEKIPPEIVRYTP
ncbi:MAG: rod shape-determining protein MreC [Acidobacteriota bacterium]